MLRALLTIVLAALPFRPEQAAAWGTAGHSVVAEIAQRGLSDQARKKLKALIGSASLASQANWADSVAMIRPETRRWHFVNIPFDAPAYDADRDCKPQPESSCIVTALQKALTDLDNSCIGKAERIEALKFVVHFIADIHQPLHVTDRGDLGGNQFSVTFAGKPSNLHLIWDFAMLDQAGFDWGVHVDRTLEWIAKQRDKSRIASGTVIGWANEAHALGQTVYPESREADLAANYQQKYLPIVYQQLGRAALRLTSLLEKSLRRSSH